MQARNLVLVELGNSFKGVLLLFKNLKNLSVAFFLALFELSEVVFHLLFSSSSIKREVSPGEYEEVMKPPEMFMRM